MFAAIVYTVKSDSV